MDDKHRADDSRRGSAPVVVAAGAMFVLVLPLLYVLSVGPAVWLVNRQYLDLDLARSIYWPLKVLVESCDWLQPIVQWYVSWFQ